MSLENLTHRCSKCGELSAKCSWKSDSDGAAWTWIIWKHECLRKQCGYIEEKECQYAYNFEEIDFCQICGKKYDEH